MSDRLFNYRDNTRYDKYLKPEYEEAKAEIVEVDGEQVLVCNHTSENLATITDWLLQQDHWDVKAEMSFEDSQVFVRMEDSKRLGSLLDHFNY